MNSSKGLVHQENLELSLIDIVHSIIQNRWLVTTIFFISLLIALFFSYKEKPTYETKLLMQVDTHKGSLTQDIVSQITNQGSPNDMASIQMALIQSRFILEPVIYKLGLDIRYYNFSDFSWKNLFDKTTNEFYLPVFKVPNNQLNKKFEVFFDNLGYVKLISPNGEEILSGKVGSLIKDKTGLYELKTEMKSYPVGTKFYAQKSPSLTAVDELISKLKIEQLGERGVQNTGILQLSIKGHDVQKIKKILNTIAKVTEEKDVQKKSQEAAKTLNFLYYQLPITQTQLNEAETKLNVYRAKNGKIDIKTQTHFLLQKMMRLDNQLEKLNLEYQTLLDKYTNQHPKMINLKEKMKGVEHHRDKLEYLLKKLPISDQITINLMRDANIKKMLYMSLLAKIQELEVIKAGTLSNVHLLTKASSPQYALPSHAKVYLLLSFLMTAVASTVLIMVKNILHNKIDDPHWVEQHYQVSNLAIIPHAKEQNQTLHGFSGKKYILLAHDNPRNLAIESLRSLRTSIQVNLLTSTNNIVSILGICPGVGKSFISANLAFLIATAGKKVLIIDADLRKGTIHKYMHLEPSPGLAEVLEDEIPYKNAIKYNIYPNLDVLTRGQYPKNPAEMLMKPKFKSMINDLSLQYDLILIDTAPVLMVTDASVIAGISANNYLIIGAKTHQSVEIDLAMKRLKVSNVQLQGTIFNICRGDIQQNVLSRYAKYGQYYYYNSYSNYYEDEKVSDINK